MENNPNFFPLLLVLFLAFFVPLVTGRIRWLPNVVVEIFAGVIIGQSGLNLIGHSTILDVMSNMGLAFLMFLAGLEINLDQFFPTKNAIRAPQKPSMIGLTFLVYLLTLALSVPGGFFLRMLGLNGDPILLAFILSATSLGVVLPVLKQRELTHTPIGQAIFLSALLADFLTVILLTFYIIIRDQGLNLEILSITVLFLAFFVFYQLSVRFFRIKAIQALMEELSHVTVQIKVRGAITILMAFVVLALLLGAEMILGAFLAGMMIALLKSPDETELVDKLEAFGFGFFIPIFFILVGANLDLRVLISSPRSLLLLPLLFGVALLVKTLPILLYRRILSWRETLSAAALINTHLSLEIAISVIGVRLALIGAATNVTIILFAVLTVLVMPVLFNLWMPDQRKKDKRFTLIYSAGELGTQVGRILQQHGEKILFFEPDPARAQAAAQQGFEILNGNRSTGTIEFAGRLDHLLQNGYLQALLVLSKDDAENLAVCTIARQRNIHQIFAILNNPIERASYRAMQVQTFNPTLDQANLVAVISRNLDLYSLLNSTTDTQDVREVVLRNTAFDGQPIRNIPLAGNLMVIAIARNQDFLVPRGYTRLELGDRLTIFGEVTDLEQAVALFEK